MHGVSLETLPRTGRRAPLVAVVLAMCLAAPWAGDLALAGGRVNTRLVAPVKSGPALPTLGNPKAPVTLMTFGDFQCPYCAMQMKVLRQIVKDHPRKVKVVWRDFPLAFHRQALPAAVAAQEIFLQRGNRAYWAFHERVFANARQITNPQLALWAGQAGASPEKMRAVLAAQNGRPHAAVERDIQVGKRLGVTGTPATFIFRTGTPLGSAKKISGSRKYADIKAEVDAM